MRIPTLVVCLISLLVLTSGCSINRAESLRELNYRSGEGREEETIKNLPLKQAGLSHYKESPIPTRTRSKVATVWIHPHETGTEDYFWGGWMSLVVDKDRWTLSQPGKLPEATAIEDLTESGE